MHRRYVTIDVFTDQRFRGNPLAVVLDAQGLDTASMQAIAREFGYSETSFVLPPVDPAHHARVRIFTPGQELPFAGHPNVGTAFALAGVMEGPLPDRFLFEEAAGLVPVRLLRQGGQAAGPVLGAEFTAPAPFSRGQAVDAAAVAASLSLSPDEVLTLRHEPVVASVGLPFLLVELASRAALRRLRLDLRAHAALGCGGDTGLYAYTGVLEPDDRNTTLQARMVGPFDGIAEDPATGSAAAGLGGLLASLAPGGDVMLELAIGQGVEMGRRSLLSVTAGRTAGRVGPVRVGGRCVQVMEGRLRA